jgi:spore coat protein U-like protein
MRKMVIGLMVVVLVAMASMAMAATKTNNLGVTANVAASCSITSVTDIAFGAYDPTSSTALDASGNMIFACVKSTSYKTYITGARTMTGGGDNLNFQLYNEVGRTTTYASDNSVSGSTAPSSSPITTSIFGRIATLQDVGANSYTATLVATVEY